MLSKQNHLLQILMLPILLSGAFIVKNLNWLTPATCLLLSQIQWLIFSCVNMHVQMHVWTHTPTVNTCKYIENHYKDLRNRSDCRHDLNCNINIRVIDQGKGDRSNLWAREEWMDNMKWVVLQQSTGCKLLKK